MTRTAFTEMFTIDNALRSMAVSIPRIDGASVTADQEVGPGLADHRGKCTLASVAVLMDSCLGFSAYPDDQAGLEYVVSNLSVSLAGPLPTQDRVTATALREHTDRETGRVLCTGRLHVGTTMFALARCGAMPVRRDRTTATVPMTAEAPIDPVDAASTQSADHPLQDVLAMDMTSVRDGSLEGRWHPSEWMLNGMGSVHGGVLLAHASTAAERTAQSVCEPGQDYSLSDISIDLIHSPTVGGGTLFVKTETTRKGRRLMNVDVMTRDAEGGLVTQARCTLQLHAEAGGERPATG